MQRIHSQKIKKIFFKQLRNETKTLHVCVGYFQIKRIKVGDIFTFNYSSSPKFRIIKISVYQNFEEMLEHENIHALMPNVPESEVLEQLRKFYPKDKEKLGVYVFKVKKIKKKTQ